MSVDICVYLARSSMPTPERWAKAIADAGFPVQMDTDFDVDAFSGFLPCKYKGVESGFEYFRESLDKSTRAEMALPEFCDFSVTLVTHSDFREYATSLVAAGVLCQMTGGVLVEPQEEETRSAADVLDWVREGLAVAETEF